MTVTSGKHFIAHMFGPNNCTFHSRKKSSRSSEQTVPYREISCYAECLIGELLNWCEMSEELVPLLNDIVSERTDFIKQLSSYNTVKTVRQEITWHFPCQ